MAETRINARKATALLREDHRAVRRMFGDFEELESAAEKAALLRKIRKELEIHAMIEEEIFYPALSELGDEDVRELLKEAFEEHDVVKTLLGELEGMDPSDERFAAKVTVMAENVEHHAEEEENELFPFFDELPKERQDEVSEELGVRKDELAKG